MNGLWVSVSLLFVAVGVGVYLFYERWQALPTRNSVVVDSPPPLWKLGKSLIDRLIVPIEALMPMTWNESIRRQLIKAGLERQLSPGSFVAGSVLVCLVLLSLVLSLRWLGSSALSNWIALLALLGAVAPLTWLRDLGLRRVGKLLKTLPFFLDLVTLSIEAGMNIAAALTEATNKLPSGPLKDELDRVLRDIRAGRPRALALQAMSDRLEIPALSAFVAAINTAEKQGAALAPIMRAQASQRRAERFSRAEKLAMEAPVKMLLPLVLFIFPSTFVILLFPIAVQLLEEGWFK